MTLQLTEHPHVATDDQILHGEPIVTGTRTPVRAIVETWQLGVPPEEIPLGMPHLTLAQVFDALSYYQDHQAEIDAYIAANRSAGRRAMRPNKRLKLMLRLR
jgi:uncharacterized protein (DUF433 family)